MMKPTKITFVFSGLLFIFASLSAQAAETVSSAYKEIGATLGTPALGNIVLGYWSDDQFPWLVRASGMDYGSTRGIQGDLGWAFDRDGKFKQFLVVSIGSERIDESNNNNEILSGTGIGPTYGFNLYGFSLQLGVLFGSFQVYHEDTGITTSAPVAGTLQIGYSYLW